MLGPPTICWHDVALAPPGSREVRGLFAYLTFQGWPRAIDPSARAKSRVLARTARAPHPG
jgi:hypothetical protein